MTAYEMPIGTVVAIPGFPGRVFLKIDDDTWQSTGRSYTIRDGWVEGQFTDGNATVLRFGQGT